MGKNPELTVIKRAQIIGLYKSGHRKSDIVRIMNRPESTVRTIIQRYGDSDDMLSKKRSGRPPLLDDEDRKTLKKIVKKNNKASADIIQKKFSATTGQDICTKMIRKNLHQIGYNSYRAAKKPLLNENQRQKRLEWCLKRQNWTVQQWRNVIWSDESKFTLFRNDGPSRVWREPGTRFNIENLNPSVKHGGGGVMVWGCFSGKGLGPLVKIEGIINRHDYIKILDDNLLPFIDSKFRNRSYKFQHDNAPIHTANDVKAWVAKKKIKMLINWPAQSPDLNPIEHLWDHLERSLRNRLDLPKNLADLEVQLKEEWKKILQETYLKLIDSMPQRIEACIANNGWPTRY